MSRVLDFKSFSKKGINILIAGDIMMSPDMFVYIAKGNDPFKYLRKFFAEYDLCIGNLETTFSGTDTGFPRFSADDNYASLIKRYFQVVFTANNHCHDYGNEGISRTIKTLEKEGILFIGTKKPGERRNSLDIEVNGHDITLLSYTSFVNGEERDDDSKSKFYNYTPEQDKKVLYLFMIQTKLKKKFNLLQPVQI
jgi:poly-gamma-glutamate capsule biosynthesis protein CapA/YwtB (metallophosphatase superfamily)